MVSKPLEIGHIVGAGQGIVHQGAAQQLAGLFVIDGLLHQSVAQPVHDAAMHLAGQQARIDDDATIGDGGQAIDPHFAGLGIDLDLAEHDPGGEGIPILSPNSASPENGFHAASSKRPMRRSVPTTSKAPSR